MEKAFTNRGFGRVDFTDYYGEGCSLQMSSLATKAAIWLGINDPKPIIMASQAEALGVIAEETTGWVDYPVPPEVQMSTRMHLSQEEVKALLPFLQKFAETGEF